MKQLFLAFNLFLIASSTLFSVSTLEAHTDIIVENHSHWHHPHEFVYVGYPGYYHEHVYVYNPAPYPYYAYPYYYGDPHFSYVQAAPSVNLNVHIP